ncbi:hypothetical protein Ancab_036089 [Ancistrocladus abbreviatus]
MAAQHCSPPPRSPASASNSESSSTTAAPLPNSPPPPPLDSTQHQEEFAINSGVGDELEKKPDLADILEGFESEEDFLKYQQYEADYARRLMAKYFSDRNIYGGDNFDMKVTINNETIKSSRWPYTQSFADPLRSFVQDHNSRGSTSAAETPNIVSNGKSPSKKS